MDPGHLSRLYEEQRKAVQETRERIKKYEQFKSDYKSLQQRLKTLPDKVSHDVMVPFGKYAFMPGQIVHTNEILVLLGDNWFTERSAKQAYHIADRRIQELDSRIKDLKEQHDLLVPRLGITSDLQAEAQGFGDIKEIVEEYDEEKERLWDEQHRKNVKRYHTEQTKKVSVESTSEKTKPGDDFKSDEDLWKRLDALEQQEAEKGELHSSFEEESEEEEAIRRNKNPFGPRVSWVDEKVEVDDENCNASTAVEDTGEEPADSQEDSSDEEAMSGREIKRVITFSHTKTPTASVKPTGASPGGDSLSIVSPADIYKLFAPKSILKKSHPKAGESESVLLPEEQLQPLSTSKKTSFREANTDEECKAINPGIIKKEDSSCAGEEKAFTGLVVEKPIPQNLQTMTLPQRQSGVQESKRTSKFRAQRLKQNPS